MLKFRAFLLICQITLIQSSSNFLQTINGNTDSIAKTIIDVIHELYIAIDLKFDILVYKKTTNHINDIIDEVTKALRDEISINIIHTKSFNNWTHNLNQSAIVLAESKENFKILHQQLMAKSENDTKLANATPKLLKFLIYYENLTNLQDVIKDTKLKRLSWTDFRFFQFFIMKAENYVNLSTIVLFSEKKCGEFQIKFLNSFDIKTQKWNKKLQNFDHFENFHSCFMSFLVVFGETLWFVEEYKAFEKNFEKFYEIFAKTDFKFQVLTNEILSMTAKKANFTLHYTVTDIQKNKALTGSTNYKSNIKNEIILHEIVIDESVTHLHWTEPSSTIDYYYLITLNELYTNYEKLLMPFDFITWILLCFKVFFTFVIIKISCLFPQWVENLIFGINNPAYNALGSMFGISQLRLPQESSNRIALLLFIWFWLIFRTCYQSKLFEFMTSDMRKPLPTSVDDLSEINYTIVLVEGAEKYERAKKEL